MRRLPCMGQIVVNDFPESTSGGRTNGQTAKGQPHQQGPIRSPAEGQRCRWTKPLSVEGRCQHAVVLCMNMVRSARSERFGRVGDLDSLLALRWTNVTSRHLRASGVLSVYTVRLLSLERSSLSGHRPRRQSIRICVRCVSTSECSVCPQIRCIERISAHFSIDVAASDGFPPFSIGFHSSTRHQTRT